MRKIVLFFLLFATVGFADYSRKSNKPIILVTGGAGYIGSHVAVVLLEAHYEVVIVDNLLNSKQENIKRIEKIAQQKVLDFFPYDMCDAEKIHSIFKKHKISGVIHLAGLKSVSESVAKPLLYYRNNLDSSINLLQAMEAENVRNLIFSSSATVYGDPKYLPLDEDHPIGPTNPYGQTKAMIEKIIEDTARANEHNNFISLRYFNPVGAHPSGLMGEDPRGIPNNLVPYILKVISGELKELTINGQDYDTPDKTGVRDFIHVMDLAKGHLAALKLLEKKHVSYRNFNLGTGKGISVLQMVNAFIKAGEKVPYKFGPRRPGDIATSYAEPKRANEELEWKAEIGLDEMVRDSLHWIKTGYKKN